MAEQTKARFYGGPLNRTQRAVPDDTTAFTIPFVGDSGVQTFLTYRYTGRKTSGGARIFELPPGHGA